MTERTIFTGNDNHNFLRHLHSARLDLNLARGWTRRGSEVEALIDGIIADLHGAQAAKDWDETRDILSTVGEDLFTVLMKTSNRSVVGAVVHAVEHNTSARLLARKARMAEAS